MSSDRQATLADAPVPARGQDTKDARAWDPTGGQETRQNRCQHCGSHVDPDTTRVLGKEGEPIRRCFACANTRMLAVGAGAGIDANEDRSNGDQLSHRGGGRR